MRPLDVARARAHRAHAVLLDCRPRPAFEAGHAPGSGHLPADELTERRYELPPRDAAVLIVAEDADRAARAAASLEALGYTEIAWLDDAWSALLDGAADRSPALAMWRPSPYLEARIGHVPPGSALDVAAGAGREAVYLAMRGFEVEAVDRAPEALGWARALAARNGVQIATREMDLEAPGAALPEGRYALVTVFRFLHRPLLPAIAAAVAPGGHLIYETFRRGQERFGRPTHPRFLFWPGEIERAFPGLEILHAEESEPPAGPIMARLHARRPATGETPGPPGP
jgi:rhodanese-related sulfurtransferase